MEEFKDFKLSYFDEWPVVLSVLELILTQKCNLSCAHCMRGPASDKMMAPDVLDAIFQKVRVAQRICLGGGDVSLCPDMIRNVVASLRKNHTIVHSVSLPTNGIVLNDDLISALKEVENYIYESSNGIVPPFFPYPPVLIDISIDDFHLNQMKKQHIDFDVLRKNIYRYSQEFGRENVMFSFATDYNLIEEGKAKTLETKIHKSPFIKDYEFPFSAEYYPEKKKGIISLSGVLTVSADGEIIPTSCSFENEKKYSVGNIKENSLSQIMSKLNTKQYGPIEIFDAFNRLFLGLAGPEELREDFNKSQKAQQKTAAFVQTKIFGKPFEKE